MTLKTITDEGKREFEELARRVENTDDPEIVAFMHGFAEKVATEVYKEARHTVRMAAHCQGCEEFTDKKMEAALQTFLGKV